MTLNRYESLALAIAVLVVGRLLVTVLKLLIGE
jgi:hypothetical protein